MMVPYCENSEQLKVVSYFLKALHRKCLAGSSIHLKICKYAHAQCLGKLEQCSFFRKRSHITSWRRGKWWWWGGGCSGKWLCLIVGEGEVGRHMMTQANKKSNEEKSNFYSISLIVLYNKKVNHTLFNSLEYKYDYFPYFDNH